MTRQEHQLILQMFTQQTKMLSVIIGILESRGVAEPSDLDAFDALLSENEPGQIGIEKQVAAQHKMFATILGVTTGLPA